ncbi:septum site-determining protein MinC [Luteimonas fraxinea]|uniref:Probable septum site-determining protein MinC n=1 Tax=Luteimonas fraxinea TaxID=2901869 RepID=A0ABS8UI60_9GAMM|nr:septum site-determining protein MinC [Luteimonas fraxinea]MCD9098404.1 septum site-determining protein MinC [Luteimonas fraxinea]MCD9127136.1 septum site-determining protein MinC [Luteimonas fraxinea]UHH10516.1 septum site-determining protein MinC [Luteimonas fraxinea]
MASRPAPAADFEPAGELKIGQVGIANLRVRTLDVARLAEEMRSRVTRAPKLFDRAAVILDFGGLAELPDTTTAQALIDALRDAGALPVALAWGSPANASLAESLDLPVLSKFRAQYENADAVPAPAPSRAAPEPAAPPPAAKAAPAAAAVEPGLVQAGSVRSGQQLYAQNRDLTVLSSVGAGAEVIADGSIHIYGPLRGRALAGAQGSATARIFCRSFHAELVAVAGHYKVLDDIPRELHGKAVQVWLEHDELKIAALE